MNNETLLPDEEYRAVEAHIGTIQRYEWMTWNGAPSLIIDVREYWYQFDTLVEVRACLKSGDFRPYRLPF